MLNLDLFKIVDKKTNSITYGCNQLWYRTMWQRRAGCGPSVVSNIFIYLYYYQYFNKINPLTKREAISIMEEVWGYVTPSLRGVNTTKMLFDGALAYAHSIGTELAYSFLDIPEDQRMRPPIDEIIEFIQEGLAKDTPIAFLNLCNGKEEKLYRWHWVTLISLNVSEDQKCIKVEILDDGKIINIDLLLWNNTTTLGGGFVYFYKNE